MDRLKGKVALITGAARGLGESQARLMAREGAVVLLTDVLEDEVSETASSIVASGGQAHFAHLDVTDQIGWKFVIERAEAELGPINVLVNNAGAPLRRSIQETTLEEWDWTFAINMTGTFLGIRTVIPSMRRAGGGSIVNISSAAALVASPTAAYAAAKAGVRSLTKSVAAQYATEGIRCNSVHPGPMNTEINRVAQQNEQAWARRLERVPMRRIGQPDEVAYGVVYLASDEASYITGTELVIDGGSTAI